MSDSLVLIHSRSNELLIVDPDEIPHSDDPSPLILLAVEVIKAGYTGVAIDELKLINGRFVCSLDGNIATPEGLVMRKLQMGLETGRPLPDVPTVLEAIRRIYEKREGQEPLKQSKREETSK